MINILRKDLFFKILFFCAAVSLLLLTAAFPQSTLAFGITPAQFRADNVLSGSSVPGFVLFTRGGTDGSEKISVEIGGPAAQYIKPKHDMTVGFEPGDRMTNFEFFIEPRDLAAGTYHATVTGTVIPPASAADDSQGGTTVKVYAGAQGTIVFHVTNDERVIYDISDISVNNSEVGRNIDFRFIMNNTGNVAARPSLIQLTVIDKENPDFIFNARVQAENIPIIGAFTRQVVTAQTDLELDVGSYEATVVFYDEDNNPIIEKISGFRVFPKGSLAQEVNLSEFTVEKDEYRQGELVRINAAAENVGESGVDAKMIFDIYHDEVLIDTASTDALFVPVSDSQSFTHTFRAENAGTYYITGQLSYGVHQSNKRDVSFEVLNFFSANKNTLFATAVGLILLIAGGSIAYSVSHHRKTKKVAQAAPNQQSTPPPSNQTPPNSPGQNSPSQ